MTCPFEKEIEKLRLEAKIKDEWNKRFNELHKQYNEKDKENILLRKELSESKDRNKEWEEYVNRCKGIIEDNLKENELNPPGSLRSLIEKICSKLNGIVDKEWENKQMKKICELMNFDINDFKEEYNLDNLLELFYKDYYYKSGSIKEWGIDDISKYRIRIRELLNIDPNEKLKFFDGVKMLCDKIEGLKFENNNLKEAYNSLDEEWADWCEKERENVRYLGDEFRDNDLSSDELFQLLHKKYYELKRKNIDNVLCNYQEEYENVQERWQKWTDNMKQGIEDSTGLAKHEYSLIIMIKKLCESFKENQNNREKLKEIERDLEYYKKSLNIWRDWVEAEKLKMIELMGLDSTFKSLGNREIFDKLYFKYKLLERELELKNRVCE